MEAVLKIEDPAWSTNTREDVWTFEYKGRYCYLKDCVEYIQIEIPGDLYIYTPKHKRAVKLHVDEQRRVAVDYMTDEGFYPWMEDFVKPLHNFCDEWGYTLWTY